MQALRRPDDDRDSLLLTSDSGCLVMLRFADGDWQRLHLETVGKSGYRRDVPGAFLAVDAQGRSLFLAALERTKFAYSLMPSEPDCPFSLSSPMQTLKAGTFTHSLCSLESQESSLFAALECDVNLRKSLSLYQVNLGLNLLTRKSAEPVDSSVYFMCPFQDGLLLASPSSLHYYQHGVDTRTCPIPRRTDSLSPARIVSSASVPQLTLIACDNGDLFKVLFADGTLQAAYFDTIPAPTCIALLKSGFLFVASYGTDHALFQLQSLGPDMGANTYEPSPMSNLVCVSTIAHHGSTCKALKIRNKWHLLQGTTPSTLVVLGDELNVTSETIAENVAALVDIEHNMSYIIGKSVAGGHAFLKGDPTTLGCGKMSNGEIIQVTHSGFHVFRDERATLEWNSPINITGCAITAHQLFLSADSKLIMFELDAVDTLQEVQVVTMDGKITCLALAPSVPGAKRPPFIAVGTDDSLVTLLNLSPTALLSELVTQVCASSPRSLCLTSHPGYAESTSGRQIFMHVVLDDGISVRLTVDSVSGELADPVIHQSLDSCLTVKELTGSYSFGDEEIAFSQVCIVAAKRISFCSASGKFQHIAGAFKDVVVVGNTVFALTEDSKLVRFGWPFMDQGFARQLLPLPHAGRAMSFDDESGLCVVGMTGGLLVYRPDSGSFTAMMPVNAGETLTSAALVRFASRPGALFVAMATARDFTLMPRACSCGVISLFLLQPDGTNPSMLHRTEFGTDTGDGIVMAVTNFHGKLLCSVGGNLRLYDLGLQRLLLKCSTSLPSFAVAIEHQGLRIVVADSQHGLLVFYYRPDDNRFFLVFDEDSPRPCGNALCMLDYDTFVVADRIGTLSFLGIPPETSRDCDADPSSATLNQPPLLFAAPLKLIRLGHVHLGQVVVGFSHSNDLLEYVTMQGGTGSFTPIRKRKLVGEVTEAFVEKSITPRSTLTGSSHANFASRFYPAKHVYDASLLSPTLLKHAVPR